jgi:phosphatidylglycerol:prolipoprotein diacylglycerol transferase
MHPRLFGFVKSYGVMLDLAFLAGIWLSVRRGKRRGLSSEAIISICFGILVAALVGSRAYYVLTHLDRQDPWYQIFFFWDGGLTFYGGILLAIATSWYMARRRGIPFLQLADVMAPAIALGLGIARIGCFLSGCCFGLPTGAPWGVCFPAGSPAALHLGGVPIHPTQLYSSAAGFAIFGSLLLLERFRSGPRGVTFARFLVLYGAARFVIEIWRYKDPELASPLGLGNNQWVALFLCLFGLLLLWQRRRARPRD